MKSFEQSLKSNKNGYWYFLFFIFKTCN